MWPTKNRPSYTPKSVYSGNLFFCSSIMLLTFVTRPAKKGMWAHLYTEFEYFFNLSSPITFYTMIFYSLLTNYWADCRIALIYSITAVTDYCDILELIKYWYIVYSWISIYCRLQALLGCGDSSIRVSWSHIFYS